MNIFNNYFSIYFHILSKFDNSMKLYNNRYNVHLPMSETMATATLNAP